MNAWAIGFEDGMYGRKPSPRLVHESVYREGFHEGQRKGKPWACHCTSGSIHCAKCKPKSRDRSRSPRFVVMGAGKGPYALSSMPDAIARARRLADEIGSRVYVDDAVTGRRVFAAAPAARDASYGTLTASERRVMLLVDAGYAHSAAPREVSGGRRRVADRLVARGLLRRVSSRFGDRYTITSRGSHALGTFAAADRARRRRKRR